MRDRLRSDDCARYLKVLADPMRLRIIECHQAGPLVVTDLCDQLQEAMANGSHHLGVLRDAGLVAAARQGRHVVYALDPRFFRAREPGRVADLLDLGCCRLALPRQ
jgi:DNA-binding transcriptional ArsR family regulator